MKKILIVDDEVLIALSTGKTLEEQGYSVATATSGEQAIKVLERGRKQPDLILMDIDLGRGRIDGTVAASRIADQWDIPVVFHSGHTDRETIEKTRAVTKYGFVQKTSGNTMFLVSTIDMALELYEAQKRIGEREKHYKDIFEMAPDGMATIDLKGNVTSVNSAFLDLTGFTREDIVGVHISKIPTLRKRDIPLYLAKFALILAGNGPKQLEFKWLHKDGREKIGEVRLGLLRDRGKVSGVQVITRDITHEIARKDGLHKSLEEKEILLRELSHRTKNSLGILSSLISHHLDNDKHETASAILESLKRRIYSIGSLNEILFQSDDFRTIDFNTYVQELVETIFSSFHHGTIETEIEMEETSIDVDTALPLGMIINELATNALKYGFEPHRTNLFSLSLRRDKIMDVYVLSVGNSGKPLPEYVEVQNSPSFGLQLVNMLSEQLKGKVTINSRAPVEFQVVFPDDSGTN